MHARIDQLLSLRDGEPVDAKVRDHVQHCAQCLAESASLAATRARMQELPAFDPPADLWPQIAQRAPAPVIHRVRYGIAAGAAVLIGAVIAILAIRDTPHAPQVVDASQGESRTTPESSDLDTQQLIAQSRQLEQLLQYLPDRPRVERVALAAAVDSIEERIQVLDWQLAYGSDAGLDRQQAHRLWSERVELMDSLVKVRYAESAPISF